MSAAQRTKRKVLSRANAGDEDELPLKKRSKVNVESRPQNSESNGRPSRRKKQVYEEEVDGFAFRRKNTRSRQNAPVAVVIPDESSERSRESSRQSPHSQPVDAPVQIRRRSARLSAESTSPKRPAPRSQPDKQRRPRQPQQTETQLHEEQTDGAQVSKTRSKGTTIVLPFADTPVIRRNKEMRAAHGKRNSSSNRRSSAGLRGRRASSLIDSGTSNAMPHADVDTANFYKLIEQSLPERGRMRHLLIWCATRALMAKPRPTARQSTIETIALESARQIQEELIKDFQTKEALSDWWNREGSQAEPSTKRPNPRNVKNLEKMRELEAEVQRLEAEEMAWNAILEPTAKDGPQSGTSTDARPIDRVLLSQSQADLVDTLDTFSIAPEPISTTLEAYSTSLEPTVDAFADGVHRLTMYANSSAKLAARIKQAWAQRLERRDEAARQAAGSDGVAGRDVLRALAGRLNTG